MDQNKQQTTDKFVPKPIKPVPPLSNHDAVNQSPDTYGKSLKKILLISLAYFGSLGVILLISFTVLPMFAWMLLGWVVYFPVYIASVGGVLFSTFSSKNAGKWPMVVVGFLLCSICIVLIVSQYKHTSSLLLNFDGSTNLFGLAAVMFGGFAVLCGLKSWQQHKVFAILIIGSATSVLWLSPVLTNLSAANARVLSDPNIVSINNFIEQADIKPQNKWMASHNCDPMQFNKGYNWTLETTSDHTISTSQKNRLMSLAKANGYEIEYPNGDLTVISNDNWEVRIYDIDLSADALVMDKPNGLPIEDACN